ncbi:MAG: DUF515 domain-containing protein [Candidatus Hydrothermarchaeales archaeon]
MPKEKTEDIIGRLEALRKRVPEEKGVAPTEEPSVEEGKKPARIVGIIVILLIVSSIFFLGYKFYLQPAREQARIRAEGELAKVEAEKAKIEAEKVKRAEEKKAFLEAQQLKFKEINDAFQGLPSTYMGTRDNLIEKAKTVDNIVALQVIDIETPAIVAWSDYRLDQVDELLATIEEIELKVGVESYRLLPEIKQKIRMLSLAELKESVIRELKYEYVPMRLQRVAAGGFPKEGTNLNIYYKKNENATVYLAKDGKIISILLAASSGSIDLTESETRSKVGGGVEGFGTVPSLSIGATAGALTGTFTGSAGTSISQTKTTFTVDLIEVQKAYAANKISKSDFEAMLDKYGMRLGEIEEMTKFGEFDREYLMLVRVTAQEAPDLVSKLYTEEDREKIYVTFTSWFAS